MTNMQLPLTGRFAKRPVISSKRPDLTIGHFGVIAVEGKPQTTSSDLPMKWVMA